MKSNQLFLCVAVGLAFLFFAVCEDTPFEWMRPDRFDEINDKFYSITGENCRSKRQDDLQFRPGTVAQKPRYNMLLSTIIYSNRSNLLHAHNMALNRAFFYSFIYQQLNNSWDFDTQPGLMYIYMGHAADVTANPGFINGSSIFFDNNCSYPNWYRKMNFNTTLPLFGPRAWRADDYNEPTSWLREPSNNTIDIHDYGSGRIRNYTHPQYKGNPWYRDWLPDLVEKDDSVRKFTYSVGIKYSNTTGVFIKDEFTDYSFFGPPQPGQLSGKEALPVLISDPYFDCDRSDRWIVTASAPVVEYMPRYSPWIHLRRARFVGVTTMDLEFERLDMNQCPLAEGNPAPNYFANTARCRPVTTMCEPLMGFGFRRGGYQCVCEPGYYYPWWHDGPFQGVEIEQATYDEWLYGFDCLNVEQRMLTPDMAPEFITRKRRSVYSTKDRFMAAVPKGQSVRLTAQRKRSVIEALKEHRAEAQALESAAAELHPKVVKKRSTRLVAKKSALGSASSLHREKRSATDEEAASRMKRIMERKYQTNKGNCGTKKAYELFLPGDVNFGVERQFEAQGRTALRLAHFLSNFLQNVDEYEEFGDLKGDRRLNETQIFAEVIANVMGDFRILGSGVFFDRYKFRMSPPVNNTDPRFVNGITREFFGPYAWRHSSSDQGTGLDSFNALDFSGFQDFYTDKAWFQNLKSRWATNFYDLKKFTAKPMIRSNYNGTSSIRFEYYPLTYRAATYEDGEWLRPEFKCDGRVEDWVVTYLAPIFGKNDLKTRIEFKGVVTVDVSLDYLDINQCPSNFYVANAFKNTARCDYQSQYCVALEGKRFNTGGYKCECRQGFEYPFNDLAWFFDGQTMEQEYGKLQAGEPNRYHTLKCRIGAASSLTSSLLLVVALATLQLLW
ncbi:uncharacterized protein LOC143282762 isoform X1 [Babylonia areolata]|uniref:uncharacterized protein LOC143282762 isoform X1 n=1 Tax=Babylonia areolata TaxID=304850 RepID=UPI003FCEEC2F